MNEKFRNCKIISIILIIIVCLPANYCAKETTPRIELNVNFFEEFPSVENLSYASLIDFPSVIFIAAHSIEEFYQYKEILHSINPNVEAGYWPILNETYYISAFCKTYELENLLEGLEKNSGNEKLKVALDLELSKDNINFGFISYFKNRYLIKQIFLRAEEYNIEIYAGEYPSVCRFNELIYNILGINFPLEKYPHNKIIMFYSSHIPSKILHKLISNYIVASHEKYGDNIQVALGIIALGIGGINATISPEILDRDLDFLVKNDIKNAYIFRLAGLNPDYIKVIHKYI